MTIRFAALLLAAGAVTAQPLEFKGVPIGATASEARQVFPYLECLELSCTAHQTSYRRFCNITDSACAYEVQKAMMFGPAVPERYWVVLDAGRVAAVDISFGQRYFAGVVAALREKYGEPTSNASASVQNRMGAVFEDRTVIWVRPDGAIVASERFGKVDTSNVHMASKAHYEARLSKAKDAPKADAKRL